MAAPPRDLIRRDGGKIVFLVIDGLGGLPHPDHGATEMEAASVPNLDAMARESSAGRAQILTAGLTPGSGPGHLSLFGYDPFEIDFGRGVLEALGSNYPLGAGELAARGNFCTLDPKGVVTDRRADRPTDEECKRLCAHLESNLAVDGVECQFLPGKQHRFTLILKGEGLGAHLNDNDPQVEGKKTLPFVGRTAESERTAALVTEIFDRARELLADESQATGVLLRGFSARPDLDTFDVRYGLRAAAIAIYPMYSGVARLVGMDVLDPGDDLDAQIAVAKDHWDAYDFFFIHTKATDQAGHSGDFDAKVEALEEIDRSIPALRDLGAAVTVITGDHSTPCVHREHSWHPVPTLIESGMTIPVSEVTFNERGVLKGDLGTFSAQDLLPLCLAHAGRLDKFGA